MVIIDTSVSFKWFDDTEPNYSSAIALLTGHLNNQNEIYVPELFLYEITNAWSTKSALTTSEIEANLEKLHKYSLNLISVNFLLLNKACNFSKKYKVSVYDASYAVLAEERGCDLITADEKFVRQVNLKYVKLLL